MNAAIINDVHSRLNETRVAEIQRPQGVDEAAAIVRKASREGRPIAISGGRHAMGGQQFRTDAVLIDTTGLDRVVSLDRDRGVAEVEGGVMWPGLIDATRALQPGDPAPWTIRQKQTGADDLTLAGSVSANAHGRGLRMGPMVDDIESLTIIDPSGELVRCSREVRPELFASVVGGYGLFGIIASVELRLQRLIRLRRHVEITDIDSVVKRFDEIIEHDARYGDFQFALHDDETNAFLRRGVMSVYLPTDDAPPPPGEQRHLSPDDWIALLDLAHRNKPAVFQRYTDYYMSTNGQVYDSDTHQLSTYLPNYAELLAAKRGGGATDSLMITELYAPPARLLNLLEGCRGWLRETGSDPIYGTIRLIEPDTVTVLPWARERFACVIFNLRVGLAQDKQRRAAEVFRGLIDIAIGCGGSYFLTYHRWATDEQLRACYPRFDAFLEAKRSFDPEIRFGSDWFTHYAGSASA